MYFHFYFHARIFSELLKHIIYCDRGENYREIKAHNLRTWCVKSLLTGDVTAHVKHWAVKVTVVQYILFAATPLTLPNPLT